MQRSVTKNTRGPNAVEKRLMDWTKRQPCVVCYAPPPSICDHLYGQTFRHNKVLIGMIALLSYCPTCDAVKTLGSHAAHLKEFGFTQAELFLIRIQTYPRRDEIPDEAIEAIRSWNR